MGAASNRPARPGAARAFAERSGFAVRRRRRRRAGGRRAGGAAGERHRAGMRWSPTRPRRRWPRRWKRCAAISPQDYRDGLGREDFARLPRAARLALLREELKARRLDGFIVPRADEHQGEYVPSCGQRLAWLTGFTGSAGMAIVLAERAALFVDGRYTLAGGGAGRRRAARDPSPGRRAAGAMAGRRCRQGRWSIGYDPWLHTPQEVERLQGGAARAGASLKRGRQPDRPGLARPAAGAARPGGAAAGPVRRRERALEAHPARPGAGRGRRSRRRC